MKKDNHPPKPADADIEFTGMHLSEIADVFKSATDKKEADKEEIIVNEQKQNEVTNQEEEDKINGSDNVVKKGEED